MPVGHLLTDCVEEVVHLREEDKLVLLFGTISGCGLSLDWEETMINPEGICDLAGTWEKFGAAIYHGWDKAAGQ
jgi:hypothetical protein